MISSLLMPDRSLLVCPSACYFMRTFQEDRRPSCTCAGGAMPALRAVNPQQQPVGLPWCLST